MKKTIIVKVILLISTLAAIVNAQITTKKYVQDSKVTSAKYDGTKNFLGKNVYQYIGQKLYVNGMPKGLKRYGYSDFFVDYTIEIQHGHEKSNVYKCCDSFNSKYDQLFGRYFKVLEVIKHPEREKQFFLKLKAEDNGDIVYFKYDSDLEHSFPFIVVAYFEKQKKKAVGKKYISRGRTWNNPVRDINTGKPIDIHVGTVWKSVDLVIEEEYYTLSVILENSKGEQAGISPENINESNYSFIEKSQAERYRKKFGNKMWRVILSGKVKLGMTKEMCRLSWGEPTDINKTVSSYGVHEQWVYSLEESYLYFENGKLKAVQ